MNIRQMERLAYDLGSPLAKRDREADEGRRTLDSLGVVNRATARRAGLRNPKKQRRMAVPK